MRQKSKLVENAISVSAEKVMAPISIPKLNPGFGFQYQISVSHYSLSDMKNLAICWSADKCKCNKTILQYQEKFVSIELKAYSLFETI